MFEFEEDREHFEQVLRDNGGVDANSHLFDFRDPDQVKRKEFNSLRDKAFADLKETYGSTCQLSCHPDCGKVGDVVDHLIPLSSNKLNKLIRGLKATADKKVPTQSFGSNHPDNFVLSCRRCNAFKSNKIPTTEMINLIFQHRRNKAA